MLVAIVCVARRNGSSSRTNERPSQHPSNYLFDEKDKDKDKETPVSRDIYASPSDVHPITYAGLKAETTPLLRCAHTVLRILDQNQLSGSIPRIVGIQQSW